MKSTNKYAVVFVTAPDIKSARKLAQAALKGHVAACANLIPKIESHYWWKGKLESSSEVLVLFKTSVSCIKSLEEIILKTHPYDTPEIIMLPIKSGNKKYLKWIQESL